jgi:hypothetical protein
MGAVRLSADDGTQEALALETALTRFIAGCRSPALLEPGDEELPLSGDNHVISRQGARVFLQAWDQTRNLVRLVRALEREEPGRLELRIEKFAKRTGALLIVDTARPKLRRCGAGWLGRPGRSSFGGC